MTARGFIVYRIYYEDGLVYVGRTKQPLQNRIRGHLFGKPMHRTIGIELVTKIEYAELQTEADMNLYEIYYILKLHPPLNVDDKTPDFPTVTLPELEWKEFHTHLWQKWIGEIAERSTKYQKMRRRFREIPEAFRVLRSAYRMGEIGEDEYYRRKSELEQEQEHLSKKLWG